MTQESYFSFKRRTESIQILRACLAFLIFLSHFESISKYGINLSAPVFIFYTISGFVAMLSTRDTSKVSGFLKKRFIRLLPLYWAVTIITFVAAYISPSFMSYTPDFIQLFKSLFCIPFYRETMVNNHMTMRPIVGPAHTLEVEILFSILFYVCMRLNHKHRGELIAGVCLIFFIAGELLSVFKIDTNIASIDFYIIHNRSAWLYFLLGIVIFKLFNNAEAKSVPIPSLRIHFVISIFTSAIIFVIINSMYDRINTDIYYSLQAVAGFFLLSFLIILSQYSISMPKFLVFFGNISFSFYLLHYYIVNLTEKVLHVKSFGWILVLAVIIAFTASLLVAYISYLLFEKRLPKLLSRNTK